MAQKTNDVFMSCIVDDVYKELSITTEERKRIASYLKANSSASNVGKKEDIPYLKCMKLLYTVTSGNYLDLEEFYDEDDVYFTSFLKEILSKITIKTTFEMEIKGIHDWFYSMGRRARSGRTEEYQRQDQLVSHGIKNTEYLNQLGIKMDDNRFIIQQSASIIDQEDRKLFVKSGKKRA